MNPAGAVALVTGASSGIGRATALRLARSGACVLATGRDDEALGEVAEATEGRALIADLGSPGAPRRLADDALGVHGHVDVLVNNAALGWAGDLARMPADRIEAVVAVNLLAPMALTRALLPRMLERGTGHIVNVTSVAGHVGVGDEAVYAATKAGLVGFTESLRYQVGGRVGVSLVSPGVVDTPFFARRGRPYDRRFPRPIPPDRVAAAILRAIARDRAHVVVPGWLAFPIWLRGAAPSVYRAMARRFG